MQGTYTGRATKSVDESGVTKITQTDALGRVTAVCEVSSVSLQSVAPVACNPATDITGYTGFLTTYAYTLDGSNDQVTTVTQGQQTRIFTADSLGRTVSVTEPETGTTTYSYTYSSATGLGLTVTRKRPRANQSSSSVVTTTTTQYDAVGRVVSISYDDQLTPGKAFSYDLPSAWPGLSQSNLKGRLSLATISTGTASTSFSYGPKGGVAALAECVPSTCNSTYKLLSYNDDWTGNRLNSSDGAGVVTTNVYTVANEVKSITSSYVDATHPPALVSNIQNGASGPISYNFGNGLSGYLSYDSLGRRNGQWVCTGSNPSASCSASSVVNGFTMNWRGQQLASSTDSVLPASGVYGYDDFNRLTSTSYNGGSYAFNEVYDRYGNRWQQNQVQGGGAEPNISFDAATNHINAGGYSTDAAGNVINDGFHAYTFDAEGNLIKTDNGTTNVQTFDALNHRVRVDFSSGSSGVELYYNPSGQRVSMWDAHGAGQYQGNYFWGGSPLALYYSDNKLHFEHFDWVGTERMRTSYNGGVETTMDSLPFGDGATVNGLGQDTGYFAGMQYDFGSHTNLAQFRQYSEAQGRWLSPDPYSGSYDLSNPQSLNRYAYVGNNPLTFSDPSGLDPCKYADDCAPPDPGSGCGLLCGVITIGIGAAIGELISLFEGGPSFHGTLGPRPSSPDGIPYCGSDQGCLTESLGLPGKLKLTPNIAGALGLPNAGCEFGACGVGEGFQQGAITAPLDWCGTHPRLCAAAADAAWTLGRSVAGVAAASAMILSMEGDSGKAAQCAAEWKTARLYCAQLMSDPSRAPNIWGGDINRCTRGQVSQRCGGNRVN